MNTVTQNYWTQPYSLARAAEEHGYNFLFWHLCKAEREGDTAKINRLEEARAQGGLTAAQDLCREMERAVSV